MEALESMLTQKGQKGTEGYTAINL